MIIVSSTEPPALLPGNKRMTLPEEHGVDVLWSSKQMGGLCGVQRKEFKDYVASLRDQRLGKELLQMGELKWVCLVIEGNPQWTSDGVWVNKWGAEFTKSQLQMSLLSVQERGVRVAFTASITETSNLVTSMCKWTQKDSHNSLLSRGDASSLSTWGKASTKEYCIYLLMGLPGISYTLAERIYEMWGVPWQWKVTMEQLMAVQGIGKVKAEKIYNALGSG